MNPAIAAMLEKYDTQTRHKSEQALREILQEVALLGIWRAKLFEHMAFYGGTALRILYGLDRFSEDLDFTMLKPESNFKWEPFANTIEREIASFGFDVKIKDKTKSISSSVNSAFLKTNTLQALIHIGIDGSSLKGLHPDTQLRIKVEVDTDPVPGFQTENVYLKAPFPVSIATIKRSDLFASKLHAALYRAWKNRVKGRDWYDMIWFVNKEIPARLELFQNCLRKDGLAEEKLPKTALDLQNMLLEKLDSLDLEKIVDDLRPFVPESYPIDIWTKDFIVYHIRNIKIA